MREHPTNVIELGRILVGDYGSPTKSGPQGAYVVLGPEQAVLKIICADGKDEAAEMFEHVSVSARNRTPTWGEMQWVKEQFWEDHEVCFQVHPSKSQYVNHHPYCLHIWRHRLLPPPLPPSNLIGPRSKP